MIELLLTALFAAPDPALLAPGPKELEFARKETRRVIVAAEAIGGAVGRLQNQLGEWRATGVALEKCELPLAQSVLARLPQFVVAHRKNVQSSRAKLARLLRIARAPTVAPILSPATAEELAGFEKRVDRQMRVYVESLAWFQSYAAPLLRTCRPRLLAEKLPGIGGSVSGDAVAVLGFGGGVICPSGVAADGQVVTVERGLACHSADGTCRCTAVRVEPAAILGPTVTTTVAIAETPMEPEETGDAGVRDAGEPRFLRLPALTTTSTRPNPDEDLEIPLVEMEPFPTIENFSETTTAAP